MSKRRASPWNIPLMNIDRLGKGWSFTAVAIEAGVSVASVTRFFRRELQSPSMAKKIALALGYPIERYVIGHERAKVTA